MVRPIKETVDGYAVAIRVSSMADPDDYMPPLRALAALLNGSLVFEQRLDGRQLD